MSISKSPNMPFKTQFFVNWLEPYITHKRSLPITLPREAPSLPMAGRVRSRMRDDGEPYTDRKTSW